MSTPKTTRLLLTTLGFDLSRLPFTVRTAVASWLALLVATLLHLDSPHWAAMTVWVVAQPTRGMLLEKSLYRAIGTIAGSLAGLALLRLFADAPVLLVGGLALWIGLCAGVGNSLRHFRAYGVLLAGCTASMVALVDFPHPDHGGGLALARVACVFIGLAMSGLMNGVFAPSAPESDLAWRVHRVGRDTLRWAALALGGAPREAVAAGERRLLVDMAAIEDGLDQRAAGSPDGYRRMRHARSLLSALLSLMVATRAIALRAARGSLTVDPGWLAVLVQRLEQAADGMEDGGEAADSRPLPVEELRAALGDGAPAEALRAPLVEFMAALQAAAADHGALQGGRMGRPALDVLLHRDWVGARAAMLRTVVAVLAVGGLWVATGWTFGPFMLMGTCIMATLFSTFDDPVLVLRNVLMGAVAGAVAAGVCRLLLLPLATGAGDVLVMVAPFLLAGGLAMANRRTMLPALDYNMCFLLLVQPVFPLHGTPGDVVGGGVAVVLGITAAMLAFRFVLPVDALRRLRTLLAMTVRDLERLARAPSPPNPARWQARFHHRILRLARGLDSLGDGFAGREPALLNGGLAAFVVGKAILRAKALRSGDELPDGVKRGLDVALARLSRVSREPDAAALALDRAAVRLAGPRGVEERAAFRTDAEQLRDAAEALRRNRGFFAGAL